MKPAKIMIAILTLSLLSACGSNPDALKKEGCENFLKGVDRLNVDDTAYESFNKAYKAFDKLAKNDSLSVCFFIWRYSQRGQTTKPTNTRPTGGRPIIIFFFGQAPHRRMV